MARRPQTSRASATAPKPFAPLEPAADRARSREPRRWIAAAIAAAIAAVLTWQAVGIALQPVPAIAFTTDTGEALEVPSRVLALLAAIYALLWWIPALGTAFRRRWGLNMGIGAAGLTLLFALSLVVLAGPALRRQGYALSNPLDWALPVGAAAFLILAFGLRRRWR